MERRAPSRANLTCRKNKFFVTVYARARWVKPAWPAGPIFSIPTFLIGGWSGATPAESASIIQSATLCVFVFSLFRYY